MTNLSISFVPQECYGNQVYKFGDINVRISLEDNFKCSGLYYFLLYNDQLMLLADAETKYDQSRRLNKSVKATLQSQLVWIPGKYFLLVRNDEDKILRFNLTLDNEGKFITQGKPLLCPRMSDEDMLSGRLYNCKTQWKLLSRKPGTMQLKRWVINRAKQNELNSMRSKMQKNEVELCSNLLISGKTTGLIGPSIMLLLHSAEIDSEHMFGHLDQFYDMTKPNPYESMTDFFSETKPHNDFFSLVQDSMKAYTFVFSDLGTLFDSGGKLIMKTIQAHWPARNKSAIFYGTQQEIAELLEQYPSLEQHFPAENRLSIEPYTREEMIFAFFEEAKLAHLELTPEAVEKVCSLIAEAFERGLIAHFDRLNFRDYVERNLLPRYKKNNIGNLEAGRQNIKELEVLPCDIDDGFFLNRKSHYSEALEELQAMVGLTEIKRNIHTLSGQMKFFQERRLLGLHTTTGATYHAILTGNPGTGKTTVAKLLGKIYHSLGLLSKGDVVYVDRRRIIGRYIGETEENMKLILKEAQGNVLFVDEAYTLYTQGDERDFGRHAVECLLDVLSRKEPDMLVIFAGYEKEMDALLSMNQGLASRFPYRFHFPNYTAEELMEIGENLLAKDEYKLTDEARDLLLQAIREAASSRSESFGNARWVEQFVRNGIIPALADRVSCSPHPFSKIDYQLIEAEDIRVATEKFNPKSVELKRRPAIGFCA